MKQTIAVILLVAIVVLVVVPGLAEEKTLNKYVGVKTCSPCHKSGAKGNQAGIWQKSKHAGAFKSLLSEKAVAIAKEKGLKKPASESPECLDCHVGKIDAKLAAASFDPKDGVQCETCHGAGSTYKSMAIMKDKVKAIAAGLIEYKDEAATEKLCKTCHNEKSPTFKEFKFKDMWAKIKHPAKKS
jgi:excinuclease UvrABC ATPase subunit